jgi:pilus assembly protein Flp/PilA
MAYRKQGMQTVEASATARCEGLIPSWQRNKGNGQVLNIRKSELQMLGDSMTNITKISRQFVNDESGQDLIEYALVAAVIALGAVTAMQSLAQAIGNLLAAVTNALNTAA